MIWLRALLAVFAFLPAGQACGSAMAVTREGADYALWDGHLLLGKVIRRADGSPWLSDLRLSQNTEPAIGRMSLFWWQYVNNETPGRSVNVVRSLQAHVKDKRIVVSLMTSNAQNTVTSNYTVSLERDRSIGAYRVSFDTVLSVQPGAEWVVSPQGGVEFTDIYWPLPRVVPATVPYTSGVRKPDWDRLLYRDGEGHLRSIALNHADGADKYNIYFDRAKGFLGISGPTQANPVFEMDEQTAAETFAELCANSYDVHLIRRVTPERQLHSLVSPEMHYNRTIRHVMRGGDSLRAHFRLRLALGAESTEWRRSAAPLSIPEEWLERWRVPVYETLNRFREPLRAREADPRWYWETDTPGAATWDRSTGYDDAGSLRLSNTGDGQSSRWKVALGREFFGEPFVAGRSYVLTAKLRCTAAAPAVASIGFRFGSGEQPQWTVAAAAGRPADWQDITIQIPAQADAASISRAYIFLSLQGRGAAWFDNVELRTRRRR